MNNVLNQSRDAMVAAGRTKHLCNFLMQAKVGLKRKVFDPTSVADRQQYAHFMVKGQWKDGKSFQTELPFSTVPTTVQTKLLRHFLKAELAKVENSTVVPLLKRA
jgi:hypothetical protein